MTRQRSIRARQGEVPRGKRCAGCGCSIGSPVAGGQINTYNSTQGIGTLAGLDDSCSAREALQLDLVHLEREEGEPKGGKRRRRGEEERVWEGVCV